MNQLTQEAPTSPNKPAVSFQPAVPPVVNAYHGMTTGQASKRK